MVRAYAAFSFNSAVVIAGFSATFFSVFLVGTVTGEGAGLALESGLTTGLSLGWAVLILTYCSLVNFWAPVKVTLPLVAGVEGF